MSQVRIAIAGASGRMGRMLIETTLKAADMKLVAAFEQLGSPFVGKDAGVGDSTFYLMGASVLAAAITTLPLSRRPWASSASWSVYCSTS